MGQYQGAQICWSPLLLKSQDQSCLFPASMQKQVKETQWSEWSVSGFKRYSCSGLSPSVSASILERSISGPKLLKKKKKAHRQTPVTKMRANVDGEMKQKRRNTHRPLNE